MKTLNGKENQKFKEYTLPSFYTSFLINGDDTGLLDHEKEQIFAWIEKVHPGVCIAVTNEEYYSSYNDLNNQGAIVSEFIFETIEHDTI